jgi:hypothetical protein
MKADAGGRELFSGIHFGLDDWGIWRLNTNMNRMIWIFVLLANVAVAQQSPLRASTNADLGNETNKSLVAVPMGVSHESFLPTNLKEWIDIFKGVSVIAASIVAWRGITAWRREFVGKRRIELAEEVLALFYQARDVILFIRQRFNYTGEGLTRNQEPGETPRQKEIRDRAYVVFERYNPHREIFSRIASVSYRFMAQFGADKAAPFNELASIMDQIFCAAREWPDLEERLERLNQSHSIQVSYKEYDARLTELNQILRSGMKNDPIQPRLDKLIADIKKTCEEQIIPKANPR